MANGGTTLEFIEAPLATWLAPETAGAVLRGSFFVLPGLFKWSGALLALPETYEGIAPRCRRKRVGPGLDGLEAFVLSLGVVGIPEFSE